MAESGPTTTDGVDIVVINRFGIPEVLCSHDARILFVDIDEFAETLPGETPVETVSASEVAAQLQTLPARQRDVLQSIAVDSVSIKDTATKFSMSEGAVRVALHRALTSLTAKLREQ